MGVHFPLINNARCDVLEYPLKNPSIYLYHQGHRRHALLQFIHPLWQNFVHIPAIVVCKVISPKFENPKPSPVGRLQCNNYSRVHWLMNSCAIGRQAIYFHSVMSQNIGLKFAHKKHNPFGGGHRCPQKRQEY